MYRTGVIHTIRSHVKTTVVLVTLNKMTQAQAWEFPYTACHHKLLGNLMCESTRPYTLKGKDETEIDFMSPTMIDPASSWFEIEIVELPVTTDVVIPLDTKGQMVLRHVLTNKLDLVKQLSMLSIHYL